MFVKWDIKTTFDWLHGTLSELFYQKEVPDVPYRTTVEHWRQFVKSAVWLDLREVIKERMIGHLKELAAEKKKRRIYELQAAFDECRLFISVPERILDELTAHPDAGASREEPPK